VAPRQQAQPEESSMMKHQVRTPEDALSYLTDCTLATVSDLAGKKSRSAYEYQRQKNMAQFGVDQLEMFWVTPDSRIVDVIAAGNVELWAEKYDVKLNKEAV
jgi:hypothetical protein